MLSMAFIANAQQELPKFPDVKVEDLKKKVCQGFFCRGLYHDELWKWMGV
jgi:hypothetical protein